MTTHQESVAPAPVATPVASKEVSSKEASSPKDIIASISQIQQDVGKLEMNISSLRIRLVERSAALQPLLVGLRNRFGITQAELCGPGLAKSRVARLESGKEVWTAVEVEEYMAILGEIIASRAAAFQSLQA